MQKQVTDTVALFVRTPPDLLGIERVEASTCSWPILSEQHSARKLQKSSREFFGRCAHTPALLILATCLALFHGPRQTQFRKRFTAPSASVSAESQAARTRSPTLLLPLRAPF